MTKQAHLDLRPIAFMVLLFLTASAHGNDLPVPADVAAAIEKTLPGATIVSQGDINEKSCGRIPKTPGIVRGDFNGDGRLDFAALLKLRTTGKSVHWEGKTLQETEFAFAIFWTTATAASLRPTFTGSRIYLPYWPTLTSDRLEKLTAWARVRVSH